MGRTAVESILSGGLVNDIISAAGVLGCIVIGALTGQFVSVSTPLTVSIGETVINIQEGLLDKIMPKLLPLVLVFIVFSLLRKGKNPTAIMVGIAVVGIIGSLWNLLFFEGVNPSFQQDEVHYEETLHDFWENGKILF